MDYNKFEDRISSWIEGDLDLKDRKEFEAFLAENPEYQSKVDEVRNIISRMRESDSLKLSEEFDKKLAEKIGRPMAYRAVANACGKNPDPKTIPCHRVVRSNGNIGGYSLKGGINKKRKLLKLENKNYLS